MPELTRTEKLQRAANAISQASDFLADAALLVIDVRQESALSMDEIALLSKPGNAVDENNSILITMICRDVAASIADEYMKHIKEKYG